MSHKNFFWPFGPQFGLKIWVGGGGRGGAGGPSPVSATVKCNLFYEYCSFTVGIVEIHLSLQWFHKSRDCFFIDKNKLHCGC